VNKLAQNVAQTIFWQNKKYIAFSVEKRCPKTLDTSAIKKKPAQSKESPYGRQKLFLKKRRRGERKFRHRRQKKKN
jgi:hypothetical protein